MNILSKSLLCMLLLFSAYTLYAQQPKKISGKVTTKESKPLPMINVMFKDISSMGAIGD